MAFEADRVVVELIAKTDQLDGPVKQSATTFDQSMNKIESSAGRAEKAHSKLTTSVGNNRIAMMEFSHIARGTADQIAAGAAPTQVLAQHMGMLGQAITLAGGTANKFTAFLGGPWGLALTVAIAILGRLILTHKGESDAVGDLVTKLREHAEKTRDSEAADRIWAGTLDGLIERQHRLNEELGKRLIVQAGADKADLERAQNDLAGLQKALADEKKRNGDLKAKLAAIGPLPGLGSPGFGQGTFGLGKVESDILQRDIIQSTTQIATLEKAITDAQQRITRGQITVGEAQGAAIADLSARAKLWADLQLNILRTIEQTHPEIAKSSTAISEAFNELEKAVTEAGSVGVGFDATTHASDALNNQLNRGQITVRTYTTEVLKLAKALQAQADAAKEAAKQDPVKQFKQSVIGAEGTGPNRLGSSAAGFGQFMPKTWLSYFDRLFPDKTDLSDAAKLAYRNIRTVAEAVIDKATDDYKAVLKSAGQQLTAANLYAVHLLGSKDVKKLFAAAPGTQTSQFLSPAVLAGNPFLKGTAESAKAAIAKRIGDSSGAVSQGAVALAQAIEQEKERLRRFVAMREGLEGGVIDARRDLLNSAQDIADVEAQAVAAAHDKYEQNVNALEAEGKLLPDEAKKLREINDERERYRLDLVQKRLRQAQYAQQEEAFQRASSFQQGSADAQAELLHSQEGLVKTARERGEIEQRLINLQFAEERLKNQYVIDWAARVQANKDASDKEKADAALAAQIAEMHQSTLDQRQANATYANGQANASPLQSYFNSIPNTANEINDALENVATHGLQNFTDALTDAIINFHSLGDVGRAVLGGLAADLIKLAIQQVILHTIGHALGAASIAATTAQAAAAGAAWAGPAALASLATLGANAAPAAAALASTSAIAALIGAPKAGGGRIFGPGSDTSDNILTPMSPGEFAIRASAARSLGYDTLEYMNQHGRLPVNPTNATAASGHSGGFSSGDLRQLEGIVSRAIDAMPDVSLYASLDPADMLQRALGTPAGHKALLAHLGNNSGAVNAQLRR